MNSPHPIGALHSLGGAPETPRENALPDYSQSAAILWSGLTLGAVIRKTSVSNAGDVAVLGCWNYELETWEPVFDPEKHVQPLKRIESDPSHHDYKTQTFAVPYKPFADPTAFVTFYTLEDGRPKDVWCSEERGLIGGRANLGL